MGTTQQHFNLVRISKSSWVAVHISQPSPDADVLTRGADSGIVSNSTSPAGHIFAQTVAANAPFTERHPRITIAMIAFILLAVSATAEFELLRQGGYISWR